MKMGVILIVFGKNLAEFPVIPVFFDRIKPVFEKVIKAFGWERNFQPKERPRDQIFVDLLEIKKSFALQQEI
jgi:hypothetical protein